MIKFFQKYHKWLSIILSIFILLFAISGIILNHRKLFSHIDISRNYLPKVYRYNNWDNGAVRGTLKIDSNKICIYGDIGIWQTDSSFSKFTDFNYGLPTGMDNRKICKLFKNSKNKLFAGTLFGLYKYNNTKHRWEAIPIPVENKRVVDITEKNDTLLVLTRSYLLYTKDYKHFTKKILPPSQNYDDKIGLFKTIWVIHNGEIYGKLGKVIVDIIGLIFIFLTITGLIFFINRTNRKKSKHLSTKHKKLTKWSLKWHNKIGWTTILLLLITTTTGMFLRPPLLIFIANTKVDKIPYSKLDVPNPWYDKLRRIIYDREINRYLVATTDVIYYSDDNFRSNLKTFNIQPPISVMGVNVFRKTSKNTYLVGSFDGLFEWNPESGKIIDYITKSTDVATSNIGAPIGEFMITGMTTDYHNKEVYFTYNMGAISNNTRFVKMPPQIKNLPMSLWNVALEFHTMRIYQALLGSFYILLIPLLGITILFILISGVVVWLKKSYKTKA